MTRKEMKKEEDDENSTEASYEYSSSDFTEEYSDDVEEYEKEYFGEVSESSTEEENIPVWEDSEDGEEKIRRDYKKNATWLDGKQPKKQLEVRRKKLKFDYEKFLFLSKCNIKLAKPYKSYFVLVDTYNIIYILKEFKPHRVFQIERFGVSDFVFINDAILFASCKQNDLKEVSFDGEMRNIHRKATDGVRKMASANDLVYLMGDHLTVMNSNYEIIEIFSAKIKSIATSRDLVYALDFNGQIFILTHNLQVLKKKSLDDKFDFKSIYFVRNMVAVGTGMGMKMFDKNMEPVKEFMNMKDEVTGCVECGDYIVYGSSYANSLKIVTPGLACFDKFPFSSIRTPSIVAMSCNDENIIICSGRGVNVLRMRLE